MADQKQLALLRESVSEWNRWREAHPVVSIDLEGATLYEADLRGANLRGANLQFAHLGEAFMSKADLRGADLRGARLSEADLRGADLRGANLNKASLYMVKLEGAILDGAHLEGASLSEAYLVGMNLCGVNLSGAHLRGTYLQRAGLSGANLCGVNLSGAHLRDAGLSGANLSGTNLRDADLRDADLRDADLRDADLRGADLSGTDLRGADLTGANLTGAPLQRVDLSEVALNGVHLVPSQWPFVKDHANASSVVWDIPSEVLTSLGDPSFTRSIEFAPEHKQAGLQILSYFGQIVEQKYPDQQVKVAIEQEGLKVRMTITAPTGETLKEIEQTLEQYGQVVASVLPATALLASPLHVMQLEHRLDMAHMELRHQVAIHQAERSALLTNNDDLRAANEELRLMLGRALGTINTSVATHSKQLEQKANDVTLLLQSLIDDRSGQLEIALSALERALPQNDEATAQQALETIQTEEPELLTRLKDTAQHVAGTGMGHMLIRLITQML